MQVINSLIEKSSMQVLHFSEIITRSFIDFSNKCKSVVTNFKVNLESSKYLKRTYEALSTNNSLHF